MADPSPLAGPSDRAGRVASDHARELREFIPLVENPRPYQPGPPPAGANPYFTLQHVLHELFLQAACARKGQDVFQHINPTTAPWDRAEARARNYSAGWGIPFATFDPILTEAKRTMRELVQVAMGNTSVPFSATDTRYPLLEERLQELANSVLASAGEAIRVDATPGESGNFIERLLSGPEDLIRDFNRDLRQTKGPLADVPLDPGTMAAGQAMLAHLDSLAVSNTSMRQKVVDLGARHASGAAPVPDPLTSRHGSNASLASLALMRVFTNGIADERIEKAALLLANDQLTANEKLSKIDALVPFPATASAEQLGEMLGVTKQAVLKTEWWIENRKGEKDNEVGRRREVHRKRARSYEAPRRDDE